MKKFLLRLLLDAILIYALAAVAFAFLHYPAARLAVGQIVTDFNGALTNVFRRASPRVDRKHRRNRRASRRTPWATASPWTSAHLDPGSGSLRPTPPRRGTLRLLRG
jgi:hypothetical protein